ncbi:alpha/beta hydrolase [Mesonia ostreae]|uniref:Alpha/beta fold hydrolase n=1 Tax=Mesonia ostreae TaxID=861110 RepID=A0ABU2KK42_9FLAO|nr:alpha/beta fold hydrolase [Mesonia ostreae]MDT0295029.1 alpha/beta fold hydrolase [Mesonia ostreae]
MTRIRKTNLKEKLYPIKTKDGVRIALWKLNSEKDLNKHILLIQGAFSNRKIFNGIVSVLTRKGFTCWVMEWRNHGESSNSGKKFNLETIAIYDIHATFDFLIHNIKLKRLHCIVHSGGGIALTMFLIKNLAYKTYITSISMFAVQAFGAGTKLKGKTRILMGKYFSALLGKVLAKSVGSTENSETYYTLKQWFSWNLNRNFLGEDGFNYLEKMPSITIPILSNCAKGDNFIAPKKGCEDFLDAFKNKENRLYYCSKENGSLEDYNHSRITLSRNSVKELSPLVLDWIKQNRD